VGREFCQRECCHDLVTLIKGLSKSSKYISRVETECLGQDLIASYDSYLMPHYGVSQESLRAMQF